MLLIYFIACGDVQNANNISNSVDTSLQEPLFEAPTEPLTEPSIEPSAEDIQRSEIYARASDAIYVKISTCYDEGRQDYYFRLFRDSDLLGSGNCEFLRSNDETCQWDESCFSGYCDIEFEQCTDNPICSQ